MFDSYKYTSYFNVSTNEIKEKVLDALWPFHPDTQPDGIVNDYKQLLKKLNPPHPMDLQAVGDSLDQF